MPRILSHEEVLRITNAFLTHPDRVDTGATSDDILKVIRWAEEIKLNMLLNKTILKNIYNGEVSLDLNKNDEVVMALSTNSPEHDPLAKAIIEGFLAGDVDDYLEE